MDAVVVVVVAVVVVLAVAVVPVVALTLLISALFGPIWLLGTGPAECPGNSLSKRMTCMLAF